MGRTNRWLQMNQLNVRNNRAKFINFTDHLREVFGMCLKATKENWMITKCKGLDLDQLVYFASIHVENMSHMCL